MKTLKTIGIALLAIVAVLVVVSFLLPEKVLVERSIEIKAKPAVVYNQVANLKNWKAWSIWWKLDPNMQVEYTGAEMGKGMKYCWNGDPKSVGIGCLTIVDAIENESLSTELAFEGMNTGQGSWKFETTENGTKVTWGMISDMSSPPVVGRLFGLLMDGMIGPDFETSLNDLKTVCEAMPAEPVNPNISEETMSAPIQYIACLDSCSTENISETMAKSFGKIMQFMQTNSIEMAGPAMAVTHKWEAGFTVFQTGVPVASEVTPTEGLTLETIPATNVVKYHHTGDYNTLESSYEALMQYMEFKNLQPKGSPWEIYITDPMNEPDTSKWITEIYFPI